MARIAPKRPTGPIRGRKRSSARPLRVDPARAGFLFTAKEVLCFIHKESRSMPEFKEVSHLDIDRLTDSALDQLLKAAGLDDREQIEEKMFEAAFNAFDSQLPVIPPENIIDVLAFRKAQKLATEYKLGSKVPWMKLREKLNTKRNEILTAYRTRLTLESNMPFKQTAALKRKSSESSIDGRTHKRRRIQDTTVTNSTSPTVADRRVAVSSRISFLHRQENPMSHLDPPPPRHASSSRVMEHHLSPAILSKDQTVFTAQDLRTNAENRHYPTPPDDELKFSDSLASLDSGYVNVRKRRTGIVREGTSDNHPFIIRLKDALRKGGSIPGFQPRHSRDDVPNGFTKPGESSRLSHSVTPSENSIGFESSRRSPAAQCEGWDQASPRYIPYSPRFVPSPPAADCERLDQDSPRYIPYSPRFVPSPYQSPSFRKDDTARLSFSNLQRSDNQILLSGERNIDDASQVYQRSYRNASTAFSTVTNVYDRLQPARSPEVSYKSPQYYEDDDWSDEGASPDYRSTLNEPHYNDLNDATFSHPFESRPAESPTAVTLRKLAELRDRIIEEKRALALAHEQANICTPERRPYDLLTSPDPDYSLDEAYGSPPATRNRCAFTFRGHCVQIPATAERARRRRRPIWHVREDPESPTPVRTTLPGPEPDTFDMATPPGIPAFSYDIDEAHGAADMDLTSPLPQFMKFYSSTRVFETPRKR